MLSENDATALHADILKIGHHGSKNYSLPEFLAVVSPQIAIISAGEQNPCEQPSPELLQRLTEINLLLLRTDQDGAIQIITDGHPLSVNCYVACQLPEIVSGRVHAPNNRQSNQ